MKDLDLSHSGLKTLEGIDLTGVTHFKCSYNQLTSLPTLPPTLVIFDCSCNDLKSLPTSLPDTLEFIDCSHNVITSLPALLPKNLQHLFCGNNKLSCLPTSLPHTLRLLSCYNNNLTCLPVLPPSLRVLSCRYNNLAETRFSEILLIQHNQKRIDLGLPVVTKIEGDQNIRHRWMLLQYDLDGVEYKKAAREIEN